MEAIPGPENTPPARRISEREDRNPSEPGDIDDPYAGGHRRAAWSVRRNPNATPFPQPFQHRAQRGRPAAAGRARDRVDAEIGHRTSDDAPVTMRRNQHMKRHQPMPRQRHHQESAVPKGDNEGPPLAGQPTRPLRALNAPAIGQVDKTNVAIDEPTRDAPQPGAPQETVPKVQLPQSQRDAARGQEERRPGRALPTIALRRAGHKGHCVREALDAGRSRRQRRGR